MMSKTKKISLIIIGVLTLALGLVAFAPLDTASAAVSGDGFNHGRGPGEPSRQQHRNRQHDERTVPLGPRQRLAEVGGGGETVVAGGPGAQERAVEADGVAALGRDRAQNRTADQSQPEHTHW